MTISRTSMVDDDGSGTIGTVFNNAWKTALYNQIDAATVGPMRLTPSVRYAMTAGAAGYNDFQPPGGAAAVAWILEPSTGTHITGIVAEPDQTRHVLLNMTGTTITLFSQHAASTPANRLICPAFGTYVLNSWLSAWIMYYAAFNAWVVEQE